MLEVEALLAPISSDQPCGPDLEYDPDMLALQQAAAGKPERSVGNTVVAAQEPDWREVGRLGTALLGKTKHLGVATLLARSACKQGGYLGVVEGLALIRGLLERYWDTLHPALDPDDGSALLRLNALAPLTQGEDGGARDLLQEMGHAPLDTALGRTGLRVRDLTLAFGFAKPEAGEAAPTEQGVAAALSELLAQRADLVAAMKAGLEHARAIKTVIDGRAANESPDLNALVKLTQAVASAATRVHGGAAADEGAAAGAAAGVAAAAGIGAIRTREDCVRALDQVCEWFAHNEPSHPAPFVIQRAKRLVTMNFMEIIRDLAPDGMRQVEDVVGKEASS